MPEIFAVLVAEAEDPDLAADFPVIPASVHQSDFTVLRPDVPVIVVCPAAEFDTLVHEWPDQAAALLLLERLHELELERAAVPPVINVTVTDPEGFPAVDGHFRVTTGPQPTVVFVDGPVPEAGTAMQAGPVRQDDEGWVYPEPVSREE